MEDLAETVAKNVAFAPVVARVGDAAPADIAPAVVIAVAAPAVDVIVVAAPVVDVIVVDAPVVVAAGVVIVVAAPVVAAAVVIVVAAPVVAAAVVIVVDAPVAAVVVVAASISFAAAAEESAFEFESCS